MNAGLIGSIIYNYYYKDEESEMTDHKITDDDVIKALECCNTPKPCDECPYCDENEVAYDDQCMKTLIRDVLPLINRQKVEIDRLYKNLNETAKEQYINGRAEAIKEFAWRLKNLLTPYPECEFREEVSSLEIDALVKEMTEDNNESQNT